MRCSMVAGIVLAIVSLGWAQAPATNEHLKSVSWMAGDWEGVEKGSDGSLKVRLHVRVSDNGQALLYDASFAKDGKITPKYQGMYYWDPAKNAIAVMQVSDEGNFAQGTYTPLGEAADQYVKVAGAGKSFELKSHYAIEKDGFHFVGQFRPEGKEEWVPAVDVTYTRLSTKQ